MAAPDGAATWSDSPTAAALGAVCTVSGWVSPSVVGAGPRLAGAFLAARLAVFFAAATGESPPGAARSDGATTGAVVSAATCGSTGSPTGAGVTGLSDGATTGAVVSAAVVGGDGLLARGALLGGVGSAHAVPPVVGSAAQSRSMEDRGMGSQVGRLRASYTTS